MVSGAINNDELTTFVTSTLSAIAAGINDASNHQLAFKLPQTVKFEVAVKATKASETGGGLRLQVFSAEGKPSEADESVGKISFDLSFSDVRPSVSLDTSKLGTKV